MNIEAIFKNNTFPTLTYSETVEVFKKLCKEHQFFHLASKHFIFQLWNKDYLDSLAKEIKLKIGNELVVEVCAGDGILSKELSKRGINIIATDAKFWTKLKFGENVEQLEAIDAVKKYKPKMVIASWIPYGSTLDYELLKTDIPFIIIIGEANGGCCGSEDIWHKYKNLNYTIHYLNNVDKFNLCRTDYYFTSDGSKIEGKHSITALFQKDNGCYEYQIPEYLVNLINQIEVI